MLSALFLGLAVAQPAGALPEPSAHTRVYYNARMALREGQADEAVKLWLLRNALEEQMGRVSRHDGDFRSVTWAALGELGVCADGYRADEDGVGLWPLALHNWLIKNRSRRRYPPLPRPYRAFEVDRQQRFISIGDVLDLEELHSFRLYRGQCLGPRLALLELGESPSAPLTDRLVSARLLQHFLKQARESLVGERVRGRSVIDARLFDIQLQLVALVKRKSSREARGLARIGAAMGLSRPAVTQLRADLEGARFQPGSDEAVLLAAAADWSIDEWMALSDERRLFLFDHVAAFLEEPDKTDAIALGILDRLIAERRGDQVEAWIARRLGTDVQVFWSGERGRRLMSLDVSDGFREMAILSMRRGVDLLGRGDLPGSLRAFAYTLQHAPQSGEAERVGSLSLRWLSFVAAQFELTDALLVTLQQLVPRREYSIILEDLMWTAAFHADARSFERGLDHQVGRGALSRRIALLTPLASGQIGRFATQLRTGLSASPSETFRFLKQLIERLELEDAEVRAAQVPTLRLLRRAVAPLADVNAKGRTGRTAAAFMARTQAIIEGLGLPLGGGLRDRARAIDPSSEVFAGSVRLAPSDPLPWPFKAAELSAPSIFTPIYIRPLEWRDASGEWVFGWTISE